MARIVRQIALALSRGESPAGQMRGLVNRTFALIWDSELPDRRIPQEWVNGWKQPDRDGNRPEQNPPEGTVPTQGGRQCYLLNLMTDPRKTGQTTVSRST